MIKKITMNRAIRTVVSLTLVGVLTLSNIGDLGFNNAYASESENELNENIEKNIEGLEAPVEPESEVKDKTDAPVHIHVFDGTKISVGENGTHTIICSDPGCDLSDGYEHMDSCMDENADGFCDICNTQVDGSDEITENEDEKDKFDELDENQEETKIKQDQSGDETEISENVNSFISKTEVLFMWWNNLTNDEKEMNAGRFIADFEEIYDIYIELTDDEVVLIEESYPTTQSTYNELEQVYYMYILATNPETEELFTTFSIPEGQHGSIVGVDEKTYVKYGNEKLILTVTVNYNDFGSSIKDLRPNTSNNDLFKVYAGCNGAVDPEKKTLLTSKIENSSDYDYEVETLSENNGVVTYKITLPIYIGEGSDASTWSGERYYLPSSFYQVQLNEDLQWLGHIPDTSLWVPAYTKNPSNAKWTQSESMGFSCQTKELKDISFDINWLDDGEMGRPSENNVKYHLFKSMDDGNTMELVDPEIAGNPQITKNNNKWTVTYVNQLVKDNIEGKDVNYIYYLAQEKIEASEGVNAYIVNCKYTEGAEEASYAIQNDKINTVPQTGKIQYAISNTLQYIFTLNLQWYDASGKAARPSEDDIKKLFELSEELNAGGWKKLEYNDLDIKGPTKTITADGTELYTYQITSDKMPTYNPETGKLVHYKLELQKETGKTEQIFAVNNSFNPGDPDLSGFKYVYVYDNTPESANVTECIDGGKIVATLKGDRKYSATKDWKFQDTDSVAKENYNKLMDKGVTLYLWRYSENEPGHPSAVTDENGTQYSYKMTSADGKSFEFDLKKITKTESDILPAYDEHGYLYTYFVKEVLPSGYKFRQEVFVKTGDSYTTKQKDGLDEEIYVLDGEYLWNIPTEVKDLTAEVEWKAGGNNDYTKTKVELVLQRRTSGSNEEWTDIRTESVAGFSTIAPSKSVIFPAVEQYTNEGKRFEFRVVEKCVTYNEDVIKIGDSSISEPPIFEMNNLQYKVTSAGNDASQGTENVYKVLNTLTGTSFVQIEKRWIGEWKDVDLNNVELADWKNLRPELTFTIKQRNNSNGSDVDYLLVQYDAGKQAYVIKPANDTSTAVADKVKVKDNYLTSEGINIAFEQSGRDLEKRTWKWLFDQIIVPSYDENGNRLIYTVKESPIENTKAYRTDGSNSKIRQEVSYSVDAKNNTTAYYNNITTVAGPSFALRFYKKWNAGEHTSLMQPVNVHLVVVKATKGVDGNVDYKIVKDLGADYSYDLTSMNNWETEKWINGSDEDFVKNIVKDIIGNQSSDSISYGISKNASSLKAGEILYTLGMVETSVNGRETDGYSKLKVALNKGEEFPLERAVNTYVDAYKDSEGQLWPAYEVKVTGVGTGSFIATNTIKAFTEVQVQKAWRDNGNPHGTRKDGLYVELHRASEKPGIDELIDSNYWLTKKSDVYGSTSDDKIIFTEESD